MGCSPYRNCNGFHKFGRAFLPGCNGYSHITEERKEMLLIAYHITLGAKWVLHYSGLRDTFLKQQARWMPQHLFIGSDHCSLFVFSLFVIASLKDTLGARCCLQAIFCYKKGLIFSCHFHFHHQFPTVMTVSFVFTRHSALITVFIPRMKVYNESKAIAGI